MNPIKEKIERKEISERIYRTDIQCPPFISKPEVITPRILNYTILSTPILSSKKNVKIVIFHIRYLINL
jgi:hypothetical protein